MITNRLQRGTPDHRKRFFHRIRRDTTNVIPRIKFAVLRRNKSTLCSWEVTYSTCRSPLGSHSNPLNLNGSLKASEIFNNHVFGEQNIRFQTHQYPNANYLNPDFSIKLPIFSIHGNHDDPSGLEMLGSLDQVSANHYVNYFGKVTNLEDIEVTPILF